MGQVARHLIFEGDVQGVGFRFTAMGTARRCGVVGYVRNLPDGTVEMLAQGKAEDIDDCIESLKETYGSGISDIKKDNVPLDQGLTDFKLTF